MMTSHPARARTNSAAYRLKTTRRLIGAFTIGARPNRRESKAYGPSSALPDGRTSRVSADALTPCIWSEAQATIPVRKSGRLSLSRTQRLKCEVERADYSSRRPKQITSIIGGPCPDSIDRIHNVIDPQIKTHVRGDIPPKTDIQNRIGWHFVKVCIVSEAVPNVAKRSTQLPIGQEIPGRKKIGRAVRNEEWPIASKIDDNAIHCGRIIVELGVQYSSVRCDTDAVSNFIGNAGFDAFGALLASVSIRFELLGLVVRTFFLTIS
jgi:hypothetical protein